GLEIRPTEELTQLAKDLVREHWEFFSKAKQVVLDGELMPWAALGKGLIEKDFQAYGLCVQEHLDFLSGDDQFSQFKVGLGFDVDEH
ncbi:hypothetical protein, partial [Vibrio cholerae]|uniref:hypothetical protein n=1 Tax=Vibrio cholerae TaxID=666 RepID=UPI003075CA5A